MGVGVGVGFPIYPRRYYAPAPAPVVTYQTIPIYQQTFVGYDGWGRPIWQPVIVGYQTVPVTSGYVGTRYVSPGPVVSVGVGVGFGGHHHHHHR